MNSRKSIIIFLCKEDPFGENIPVYTESKSFLESSRISYDDKSHKIFYNSSAFAKAKNDELKNVLEFIYKLKKLKANSPFTHELEYSVKDTKAREIGLAEGRVECTAEGGAKGIEEVKNILNKSDK